MEPALSSLSKTILFIYLQYLQGLPLITLKCCGRIIFLLFFFKDISTIFNVKFHIAIIFILHNLIFEYEFWIYITIPSI